MSSPTSHYGQPYSGIEDYELKERINVSAEERVICLSCLSRIRLFNTFRRSRMREASISFSALLTQP